MDSILIRGNGALNGVIPIAGAKNACLTLMPATLLSEEPLTLTNAPRLSDIATMTQLLQSLGAEVASLQDGQVLAMSSHDIHNHTADYDIVRKMRASILVLGPMLARDGHAIVSLPGGCAIGARVRWICTCRRWRRWGRCWICATAMFTPRPLVGGCAARWWRFPSSRSGPRKTR